MDQDNLHTNISALNADFSSTSGDLLGSKRPAHENVKEVILLILAHLA